MNRRQFLQTSATAAAGAWLAPGWLPRALGATERPPPRIPRWRGFNLPGLGRRHDGRGPGEADFALMQEWGFNFARLPVSYWSWSDVHDWMKIDEAAIAPIDEAIAWGRSHGVHVNLCLHRIPGYCVNGREREPFQLFDSPRADMERALAAAAHHWRFFARRYRAVPSERLSFDLMNEPPFMPDQSRYVEIARALIAAIREESPDRLIFADGADIGQTPVLALADEGIVQSTRGYLPKMISHYTATWVPAREFESHRKPTWPMRADNGVLWDRAKLREELIVKWQPLVDRGVPVHVGEWGCFNRTPHAAVMGWMTDLLALWKEAGWGWAMWNLRGPFGPLDSERADVVYESFRGHKVDRAMLDLLRAG